jgi:hypothetical protein
MIYSGIAVGADYADVVVVGAERGNDTIKELIVARKLQLERGPRPQAFRSLGEQLCNILREAGVLEVFIKKSSAGRHVTLSHLEAAEVRGMVFFAASGVAQVTAVNPTVLSKTFGTKKTQEYLKDDRFWADRALEELEKQYRDPCLLVIAGMRS